MFCKRMNNKFKLKLIYAVFINIISCDVNIPVGFADVDEGERGRVGFDNVVSVVGGVVGALVLPNFVRLQNAEDVVAVAQQIVQRRRPKETGIFPDAPNF
jgi:hypothetical protein